MKYLQHLQNWRNEENKPMYVRFPTSYLLHAKRVNCLMMNMSFALERNIHTFVSSATLEFCHTFDGRVIYLRLVREKGHV